MTSLTAEVKCHLKLVALSDNCKLTGSNEDILRNYQTVNMAQQVYRMHSIKGVITLILLQYLNWNDQSNSGLTVTPTVHARQSICARLFLCIFEDKFCKQSRGFHCVLYNLRPQMPFKNSGTWMLFGLKLLKQNITLCNCGICVCQVGHSLIWARQA